MITSCRAGLLKLGGFGAVSNSDTVTLSSCVGERLRVCAIAKLTVFAIPSAAKVRGVAGADVAVKVLVRLASTAV